MHRPIVRPLLAVLAGTFFVQIAAGQTVVDSTFVKRPNKYSNYSNPGNWSPREVPNNSAVKSYNVSIPNALVNVDIDATISRLSLGQSSLKIFGHALGVDGSFANFDASTRTLLSGAYYLDGSNSGLETKLSFNGADIVNNASVIQLIGSAAVEDENGNDAFRNFSHNLRGAEFTITDSYVFTARSDFTNAGEVGIYGYGDVGRPTFKVAAGHRYIQTEGRTRLYDSDFEGDMEIQGGTFRTAGNPYFGNPAVIHGSLKIGAAVFTPYRLSVSQDVQLSPGSRLRVYGDNYFDVDGAFTAGGRLEIREPDFPPASTDFFVVVSSSGGVTGEFSNAADNSRVATLGGHGSFIVSYSSHTVFLSKYQAIPPAAQLLNISARALVLPDADVTICGFIVFGDEAKRVILRGIGTSLQQQGFAGALEDPAMELYDSEGNLIGGNDDWKQTQQAEIEQTGVAPKEDREAAIIATLEPGAYTAVLHGKNDNYGVGLVELYDLSPASDSKIANISARAFVNRDNLLIGGFIAAGDGSGPAEVVVRAIGPGLEDQHVDGFLPDPALELRDSNGALIASNDDEYAQHSNAQPIPPGLFSRAKDALLAATIPRGHYTAIVRGKGSDFGTALVEVYDLNR
jgi:hypothetical protein